MAIALPAVLATGIASMLALKAVSLLASLGFAYAAYTGFEAFVNFVKQEIQNLVGGLGTTVIEVLSVLNLDRALNIIFAAYLTRLVIAGVRGGVLRRWVSASPL